MFRPFLKLVTHSAAPLALLTLVSLVFALDGCSRFTRTKQCRALIAQINPALDDVVMLTHSGGNGGGGSSSVGGSSGSGGSSGTTAGSAAVDNGYLAAAARYERLAKQLGPMEFGSEEMAKLVAEYAGILTSTAANLRSLAAALESNNTSEAERLSRELDRIGGHERSVINRMDAWCQP
jgi:hypothetical protein